MSRLSLRRVADLARNSLLLIPVSMIVGFIALAIVISQVPNEPTWIVDVDADTARSVLSVIASSTLTVTGIVISFLAITIQLAASNYTPRLVPRFLNDRFQQSIIGLIVGTFAFSVTSLADLGNVSHGDAAPDFAANIAIVLALLSTVGIISFIDRIAKRLRIDDTIQRLSLTTEQSFASRSSHREAEELEEAGSFDDHGEGTVIASRELGWILRIDTGRLARSLPRGALARVAVEVGDYVGVDSPLVTIWTSQPIDRSEVLDCFTAGSSRSIESDPIFGLRQLVDIALRALSPGVNDPTTAADVVRQLVRPLSEAVTKRQPKRVIHGEHGQRVYVPRRLSPENIINVGFNEIIHQAADQPYVIEAVLEAVDILRFRIHDADMATWQGVLEGPLDRVVRRLGTSNMDFEDRQRLLEEAERIRRGLQS